MKQTKWRYNQDIGIKELYDFYCFRYFKEKRILKNGEESKRNIVHSESSYNVSQSIYNKILKDYFEYICNDILKGIDFKLFERLGIIGIRKQKIIFKLDEAGELLTNAPVDYKSTKDLWLEDPEAKKNKTLVRHTNEHTNHYIHRWYWNKEYANFKNKVVYSFLPSRKNKRKLTKMLKEDNNIDYYTRYNKDKKRF